MLLEVKHGTFPPLRSLPIVSFTRNGFLYCLSILLFSFILFPNILSAEPISSQSNLLFTSTLQLSEKIPIVCQTKMCLKYSNQLISQIQTAKQEINNDNFNGSIKKNFHEQLAVTLQALISNLENDAAAKNIKTKFDFHAKFGHIEQTAFSPCALCTRTFDEAVAICAIYGVAGPEAVAICLAVTIYEYNQCLAQNNC